MTDRHRRSVSNTTRRSTNACHRCHSKKIKCYFEQNSNRQSSCRACARSNSDCVFDATPDGVPRGAAYIATLEKRIAELEAGPSAQGTPSNRFLAGKEHRKTSHNESKHEIFASTVGSNISIFNFAHTLPESSPCQGSLLDLPSAEEGRSLIEKAYMYTQARYCIVDWAQLLEWHERRDLLCQSSPDDEASLQTGAYFVWIMYAIGTQMLDNPSAVSSETYFERARPHLPIVLAQQDIVTVQALLVLVQYHYRAPGGPSLWQLVGATMRLCVELGLHRQSSDSAELPKTDPYSEELRKRFFWCAYCLDRSVSIFSKRPFSISDADIDIQLPVNIDVTCVDRTAIRALQVKQAEGEPGTGEDSQNTTISGALHHVRMYRIRSQILTRFSGPRAPAPSNEDVQHFLGKLEEWKDYGPSSKIRDMPLQNPERLRSNYYLAVILLIRPILAHRDTLGQHILQKCAALCADACENERVLCLSPDTHGSPINVYNCFRCGVTLLLYLVEVPQVLSLRQAYRAVNGCSSALTVYTRTLSSAQPFLELFEKLTDHFLAHTEGDNLDLEQSPSSALRHALDVASSCLPSQIPDLLQKINDGSLTDRVHHYDDSQLPAPSNSVMYETLFATDPMPTLDLGPFLPDEMWQGGSTDFLDE